MFEIFLFINPIGIYCYEVEKRIQTAIKDLDLDVSYHFIPIATVSGVQDDIIRRRKDSQHLCDLSYFTLATNQALEIYHAIKIAYGNKKARAFLFELQERLNTDGSIFEDSLIQEIYKQLDLDPATIDQLLDSKYIRESIDQDQKLAKQWQIKSTPTVIIFNEDKENDTGVLLEGLVSQSELNQLLSDSEKNDQQLNCVSKVNIISTNHLRLI
ncbi:DsbA family protein [Lactobacillus gigeriorum]|uniref:Dithiol-disulfide isomerase n=1 Tax=Lactobacillus gigeriorum DSM 23908 = CRBIP 24.85 TaxID=1423751 RepID=I7LG71_9LACO|nr:DsbA family protein [Lactobacillus gigeriorum]KRN14879.1 hypothetical protein FC38_GL000173 [Lactobacillus gigeriorum DSM 23908 = CRBIP 24.85]CCI87343.1 Dithiol-disulfide isomerase [Lactobacillus gigeriorum DSM 23908 = CRBIP 24.85]